MFGDLIAEGNLCHPSTFYFYTQDPEHCAEFVRCVEQFPNTMPSSSATRVASVFGYAGGTVHACPGQSSGPSAQGLWGCDAYTKFLPEEIFELLWR